MAYPGVYRARAARLDGSRLQAYVPQVFGDAAVTIVDFVGAPPTTSEMGWVSFHGGHPEHPVWLGTGISGIGGGGGGTVSDVLWVGTDPPVDTGMELWWDTDEPTPAGGSGGGSEEVYIGPSQPGAGYDLWVDSDEVAPLTDDWRWNTAWGTVAQYIHSSDITGITTTETTVNSGTYANFLVGRRYSLMIRQGYSQTVAGDTFFIRAYIGGTQVLHLIPEYIVNTKVYQLPSVSYVPSTSGSKLVTITITRSGGTGTATAPNAGYITSVIEVIDDGPVSGALPVSQPTTGLDAAKPATPPGPMRYFATDTRRDWLHDGTGWIIMSEPQQSYTPATTNVSFGGGATISGSYHRSDGWADCYIYSVFGTSSPGVLSLGPSWSLPFTADSGEVGYLGMGKVSLADADGAVHALHPYVASANTVEPRCIIVQTAPPATASALGQISNILPITIAVNDRIAIKLRYRMNSRYS